jgi:hypothetical protein
MAEDTQNDDGVDEQDTTAEQNTDDDGRADGGDAAQQNREGGTDWKAQARKWEQRARENAAKIKDLSPLAAKAKELEESQKTDTERLAERATSAEQRAADLEAANLRIEVALDKAPEGIPLGQLRKLAKRLAGSTREELEADAEELFADLAPAAATRPPTKKPTQNLRGGSDPEKEPERDPADLAAEVHKARRGF